MVLARRKEWFKMNLTSEEILKTDWGLLRLLLMERHWEEESTCVDILILRHLCYYQDLLYKVNL